MQQKQVDSVDATRKTLKRRMQHVQETRSTLGLDLEEEVRMLTKEQRERLLQEAVPLEIPAEQALP